MHHHLHAATAELRKALRILSGQDKNQDPLVMRRTRSIMRQLQGALGIIEGVGNTQPNWDRTDPDLLPEAEKRAPERAPKPPRPTFLPEEGDN